MYSKLAQLSWKGSWTPGGRTPTTMSRGRMGSDVSKTKILCGKQQFRINKTKKHPDSTWSKLIKLRIIWESSLTTSRRPWSLTLGTIAIWTLTKYNQEYESITNEHKQIFKLVFLMHLEMVKHRAIHVFPLPIKHALPSSSPRGPYRRFRLSREIGVCVSNGSSCILLWPDSFFLLCSWFRECST